LAFTFASQTPRIPEKSPRRKTTADEFFLLGSSIVRLLRRKEPLELIFGRVQALGVGREVLLDPAPIEVLLQRTFVHNMLASQQIGVPESACAIDAAPCNDRLSLLRWLSEGVGGGFVGWVVLGGHGLILEMGFAEVRVRRAA